MVEFCLYRVSRRRNFLSTHSWLLELLRICLVFLWLRCFGQLYSFSPYHCRCIASTGCSECRMGLPSLSLPSHAYFSYSSLFKALLLASCLDHLPSCSLPAEIVWSWATGGQLGSLESSSADHGKKLYYVPWSFLFWIFCYELRLSSD